MTPWKNIAATASELHEERGYSFVSKGNEDAMSLEVPLVNTVPEEELLQVAGKSISPKDIRTYTWENRKSRSVKRDRAIIWTFYDEASDTSFVGIGAEVKPETLDRIPRDRVIRGYESENSDVPV